MNAAPYGKVEDVVPDVRGVLARNPSPFTFTGTRSFIVGRSLVAVIDPGPDLPEHLDALGTTLEGKRVAAILVTHNHRDHSPAARPLAERTGAPIVGCRPLAGRADDPFGEAFDAGYAPDRVLGEGGRIEGEGWALVAVETPGHASNHLCFALEGSGVLFSGDHVMGWSTSIVSPPDGDMGDYLKSLRKLLGRDDRLYLPAHGDPVDKPHAHVRGLIAHRQMREGQILKLLEAGPSGVMPLVEQAYRGTDPHLYPAAARSVLAHLLDLRARGAVAEDDGAWGLA